MLSLVHLRARSRLCNTKIQLERIVAFFQLRDTERLAPSVISVIIAEAVCVVVVQHYKPQKRALRDCEVQDNADVYRLDNS
jgi:hypothetical protein